MQTEFSVCKQNLAATQKVSEHMSIHHKGLVKSISCELSL